MISQLTRRSTASFFVLPANMSMKGLLLVPFILCLFELASVNLSSEKLLIKNLITNYAKIGIQGRPVKHPNQTIKVGFGMSLFQLLSLDERQQILTLSVWAKYTWVDEAITWEPEKFSGIDEVRIPTKSIWTPDIGLKNFVDPRLQEHRDVMLSVDYTGRVYWSPPTIYKSYCLINTESFPFDYQSCFLNFSSAMYTSNEVDLQFIDSIDEIEITDYFPNKEWEIQGRPGHRFVLKTPDCKNEVPHLIFFLFLRRNYQYFVYIIVLPSVLLSLMTSVVFWLPPTAPAKILTSISVFVAFAVSMRMLIQHTPAATIRAPYLLLFYVINMFVLTIATILSTSILILHKLAHPKAKWKTVLTKIINFIYCRRKDPIKSTEAELIKKFYQREEWQQLLHSSPDKPWSTSCNGKSNRMDQPSSTSQRFYEELLSEAQRQDLSPDAVIDLITHQFQHGPPAMLDDLRLKSNSSKRGRHRRQRSQPRSSSSRGESAERSIDREHPLFGVLGGGSQSRSGVRQRRQTPDRQPASNDRSIKSPQSDTAKIRSNICGMKNALRQLLLGIAAKDEKKRLSLKWSVLVMAIDRIFFWLFLTIVFVSCCFLLYPRPRSPSIEQFIEDTKQNFAQRNLACAQRNL